MTTPPRTNTTRGMAAGMLLLSGVVLLGAIGYGIGALVGAIAPFVAGGVLLGFFAGIAAVIVRYRDL